MLIEVKLEDPKFCAGCPLDAEAQTCDAGFKRRFSEYAEDESGKTVEEMYGFYVPFHVRQQLRDTLKNKVGQWKIMRPQECILTEQASVKLGGSFFKSRPAKKERKPYVEGD